MALGDAQAAAGAPFEPAAGSAAPPAEEVEAAAAAAAAATAAAEDHVRTCSLSVMQNACMCILHAQPYTCRSA